MSVPAPFTTFTLSNGTVTFELDIDAAHQLSHTDDPIKHFEVLRAIDNSAILQIYHSPARSIVTLTGSGGKPTGFNALTLPDFFTLTCPTLPGSPLQVIALPPSEQTDAHGATVSWTLVCEEA